MQTGADSSENALDVLTVLDSLGLRRRTGKLVAIGAGETYGFFIDRGRMLMASSSWTNLRLGRTLVRRGALRNERLERGLVMQTTLTDHSSLGAVLMEDGALSREELALAVEDQCIAVLTRVLEMQNGTFLFDGNESAPRHIEVVPLDTSFVVEEATRRIDERRCHGAMQRLMPAPTSRLALSTAIAEVALDLNDDELSVALAVNRRSATVIDLIQGLDFDIIRLQRVIIRLRERGLLVTVD